ncbi:MAG: DUF6702 family protein [Gemmatimonas sp.]
MVSARWTKVMRRRTAQAMVGAMAVALTSQVALAHPLHTTLAELSYDAAARVFNLSLRVFADDFSAAVSASGGKRTGGAAAAPSDTAMFRYVRERFAVLSATGQAAPLQWCGVRRAGDVLFLCLRGANEFPMRGAKVRSSLLSEVFRDQVNMVQATTGGKRRMLLFTNRDGAKALE